MIAGPAGFAAGRLPEGRLCWPSLSLPGCKPSTVSESAASGAATARPPPAHTSLVLSARLGRLTGQPQDSAPCSALLRTASGGTDSGSLLKLFLALSFLRSCSWTLFSTVARWPRCRLKQRLGRGLSRFSELCPAAWLPFTDLLSGLQTPCSLSGSGPLSASC